MKPSTWRTALLTLCAAAALFDVAAVLGQVGFGGATPWYGIWGTYFGGSAEPYHLKVLTIDPGGPADLAGLRVGDLVDVRGHRLGERFELVGQPLSGRPIALSVRRGSGQERIVVVPKPLDLTRFWNYVLIDFGCFWLLLFGALIAWRRPYVGQNLLLATVLAFAAVGFMAIPAMFVSPWSWPPLALSLFGQALPLSIALWATFASGFARPLSGARRAALGLCYGLVAVYILAGTGTPDITLGLVPLVALTTLWFDPAQLFGPLWTIPSYAAVVTALVCSGLAIGASRGVDRQRAIWSLVPLAALYCALQWSGPSFQFLNYAAVLASSYALSFVSCITPLALTYVALNRRLIDIGFVINRTVVFAIVSSIVIGAFVLVEWAASEWFADVNGRTSAVIGMIVALTLGISLRYIHKYVDRFVDHFFFRKRHEDEAGLRRFAHEAAFISDRAVLLERTMDAVRRHTDAADVAILVRNGSANYVAACNGEGAIVGENDPAIVALRAWGKPLDLHSLEGTHLPGELAFPILSRGALLGVLSCGSKRDGETYAPDETDALFAMARGVGAALGTHSSANDSAIAALRDT